MIKNILKRSLAISVFFLSSSIIFANEFSEGPYGNGYYDIAGPFNLPDLNLSIQGDPNLD